MDPDLSSLDEFLHEQDVDGYLIEAPATTADQRYLSGFGSHDPFGTLYTGGRTHLLVRGLDRGLARRVSRADTVASPAEYGYREKVEHHGSTAAYHRVLAAFLAEHDVESVAVPERFPVGIADGLRAMDVAIVPEADGIVTEIRAVKTDDEVEHVRTAQRANERAMERAEGLLRGTTIVDGVLHHDDEPLTSERLREEIEFTLLRYGCAPDETIVAGGADAADPHERGSGPINAHEPIVIDIFPRDKETKYYGDMTRTFVVGEPTETAREWYDLTLEAMDAALDAIEPGVTGAAVHDAVCDVYEAAGVPTARSDETTETGFIHGTGHGVGLDVHELPRVSTTGGELEPGHVITIEPGLYDPAVGGIRIEDLVVVTATGYENLTDYHKRFVI